jgi:hypothetical protein
VVEPEPLGSVEERPELDVLVAADAWIRCTACSMLGVEVRKDRSFELARQVDDPELEPDDLGHSRSVGLGLRPAAPVIHPVKRDQLHVLAHDAVILLVQQGRGDG